MGIKMCLAEGRAAAMALARKAGKTTSAPPAIRSVGKRKSFSSVTVRRAVAAQASRTFALSSAPAMVSMLA